MRIRKCVTCKKELDELEGCTLPVEMPATRSFNMPSRGVELYCESCYADVVGETALREGKIQAKLETKSIHPLEKLRKQNRTASHISHVRVGDSVTIIGFIVSLIFHKEFPDRNLKMASCEVEDETARIKLILWNDMVNAVKTGKAYRIEGFVQEFDGKKQITLGYKGTIQELEPVQ